jgi:uncharacterized cupredoxin-like copper-binding protein
MPEEWYMRRALSVFGLTSLATVGIITAFFVATGSASTSAPHATAHAKAAKVTKVKVIAKEFSFSLSKRSVPIGPVAFTVVNQGKISHNFKIAGKVTKLLNHGQSQTLVVNFKKKGQYAYECTLVGHAKLGMKGKFAVGVKAVKPTPPPTTQTTTTTPTTTTQPTGTVGNASTTVTVSMFEYGFTLSTNSVPSGQVTFVVKNDGKEVHNFDLETIHAGALLDPGKSETWTVSLPPRSYAYECDVAFHAQQGMIGNLTVTP